MLVVFILMLCAYAGANSYIFIRGLQAISSFPTVFKWAFGVFYWLSALSILLLFALRYREKADVWGHVFFQYATGWLVFTLYMTMALLCFDFYRLFNRSFAHSFSLSLLLTAGVLVYGYICYRNPIVRHLHIEIPKMLTDSTATSLKVVAVSDVHLGLGTPKARLQDYVARINAQQPDLVIISGDLIDHSIHPLREARMEEELKQIKAPLGVYLAPGNHEYISGIDACIKYIRQTPIRLLRDSVAILPNGIQLVGRDDRSNRQRLPAGELMSPIDPRRPVIVLDHQPVELLQAQQAGADLLFCGHTHRGQVWPLTWFTDRLFERSYGYEQRGTMHLYVSSGLALWGPPFRIGTRGELVVFHLSFHRP